MRMAEYWARSSVFQYRYLYDAERNMLGIYSVPDCVKGIFDGTVPFQNSTDQDYTRDMYAGVAQFEKIYDKWAAKSDTDMLQYYSERTGQSLYDSYDFRERAEHMSDEQLSAYVSKELDYYRRWGAYDEIWNPYESGLEDDRQTVYLSLYGPYDIMPVKGFIIGCHKEALAECEENERYMQEMKEGKHPEMQAMVDKFIEEQEKD